MDWETNWAGRDTSIKSWNRDQRWESLKWAIFARICNGTLQRITLAYLQKKNNTLNQILKFLFSICIKLMGITWASVCLFSHTKADGTDRDARQTLSVKPEGRWRSKEAPTCTHTHRQSSRSACVEQAVSSSRDGLRDRGGPVSELLATATPKVALYI